MPERVIFTQESRALVCRLKAEQGPLIFHLSGGCCEGSAPMCFRQADFRAGQGDVLLGVVEGCPFYVGASQFKYWASFQITVDVTAGGGDSFSIEAPERSLHRPLTPFHRCGSRGTWRWVAPATLPLCARCGGLTRPLSLQLRWSDWPQFNISPSS